jgi:hypothetical protein
MPANAANANAKEANKAKQAIAKGVNETFGQTECV